jgi:hypothetical protein
MKSIIYIVILIATIFGQISQTVTTNTYKQSQSHPIPDVNQIYDSTVWIGMATSDGVKVLGSGWVVANHRMLNSTVSYVITAAHVIQNRSGNFIVGYWTGSGQWSITVANVESPLYWLSADVAIMSIEIDLPPMKLAKNAIYKLDDEVLVGGVQLDAPPAYVTIGSITSIRPNNEFTMNGWAWYGHSGGPIILRNTNEVIGLVTRASDDHTKDASLTECVDYTAILELLSNSGLDTFIKQ